MTPAWTGGWDAVDLGSGITAGFTRRGGGSGRSGPSGPSGPYGTANLGDHVGDDPGRVTAARSALAATLGVARLHGMRQVHGAGVSTVTASADAATAPEVDALVSAEADTALMVLVADCVPVLIADPVAGVVAAVHAGRRGVVADVVGAALAQMTDLGARPQDTRAVLGPAICGRCYEVGTDVFDDVVATVPAAAARTSTGRPALDLPGALLGRLADAGVAARSVGVCTAESGAHFSYRRDGVTGRFAGVILRAAGPGATA